MADANAGFAGARTCRALSVDAAGRLPKEILKVGAELAVSRSVGETGGAS